jgi:acetyl esterase/lipase
MTPAGRLARGARAYSASHAPHGSPSVLIFDILFQLTKHERWVSNAIRRQDRGSIVAGTTYDEVDPALWPLIEAFPPLDVSAQTLAAFRNAMVELSVVPDPASHPDVRVEELRIAGGAESAPTVRYVIYTPRRETTERTPGAALLHIHGGGFVMGMPEMDAARNVELARATGCTILSVDYRLAPEHPHPAGLEDCHAALVWLAAHAQAFGISPRRIGVIGESAGGGLAASVALLARDRRSVALACQVLIYPMLVPPGSSIDASSPDPRTGRHIWTRASNEYSWSAYLSGEPANPATIAGLAPDVSGLPPTFIAVGDLDLFVRDDMAYANRLREAGCEVESHVYPGAIHGFDRMVEAPVSQRYTSELVAFIRKHLG